MLGAELRRLLEEQEHVAAHSAGARNQGKPWKQEAEAAAHGDAHRCTPLGGAGPLYCVSVRPFAGSAPPGTSTTSQCSQLRNVGSAGSGASGSTSMKV